MRRNHLIALALAALLVALAGGWLCERSDAVAFLPSRAGAEWIIDPAPPEIKAHAAVPAWVTFKRTFILESSPATATLTIRAFKTAGVAVNGHPADGLQCDGENWKSPRTASVAGWLRAGTNEISVCVTNRVGPPALWLRLQAGNFSLGTDASWLASPTEAHWQPAHPAATPRVPPDGSAVTARETMPGSLRAVWPELAGFAALALALALAAEGWRRKRPQDFAGLWPTRLLLAAVLLARAALFVHDAPRLGTSPQFDSLGHAEYVQFIQEKKSLPLPNDGWEMHQPPLYYIGAAAVLGGCGLTANDERAALPLRAVNGGMGLLQCWLALLCLRRLFPQNFSAQALGLIVASFLPANLYLALDVTNDLLAGLLVTAAFYFFLRLEESENENPGTKNLRPALGIGLALGAALLAKLNSLPAVPVFVAAMGLGLLARKKFSARAWLRGVGVMLLACVLTGGWHYARVWLQIGALPLPNSQTNPVAAWWQEPGFHTADYFFHFGQSLVTPVFGGRHSFADGIYSTLWGDGLISGYISQTFRPPWNYDLMNTGYLLALVPTGLAVIGLVVFIGQFMRRPEPVGVLILGLLAAFAAGILFLVLRGPWLAHVKAFYALPALVPFCALVAAGGGWLAQKNRAAQTLLRAAVLAWAFTAAGAFWIRDDNGEFWRMRAVLLAEQNNFAGAAENISRALRLNPNDADNHRILGRIFAGQDRPADALREYEAALKLRPDYPEMLDAAAQILINGDDAEAARAVTSARRACELTGFRQAKFVSTLAAACARAGQWDEAAESARIACILAAQGGWTDLAERNQKLLERCREHKTAKEE